MNPTTFGPKRTRKLMLEARIGYLEVLKRRIEVKRELGCERSLKAIDQIKLLLVFLNDELSVLNESVGRRKINDRKGGKRYE